jgi:uncharacterized protein (AIM24 family)
VSAPTMLPTQVLDGSAPGVRYRLEGELVPVLHMELDGSVPVYFEHNVLLWKYPTLEIGLHSLRKGLKNVFEKQLEAGESIDIEPGGWVYRDHSVEMSQQSMKFKTGMMSSESLWFNRFTGPGRVGVQSAYYTPPATGDDSDSDSGGGGFSFGANLGN